MERIMYYAVGFLFSSLLLATGFYLLWKLHNKPPSDEPWPQEEPQPRPTEWLGVSPVTKDVTWVGGTQEIRFDSWEAYNAYIEDYCRKGGDTTGLNVRFEGYLPEKEP